MTEPYTPQIGHRVRYIEIREGTVTNFDGDNKVRVENDDDNSSWTWLPLEPSNMPTAVSITWERLPDQ